MIPIFTCNIRFPDFCSLYSDKKFKVAKIYTEVIKSIGSLFFTSSQLRSLYAGETFTHSIIYLLKFNSNLDRKRRTVILAKHFPLLSN